MALSMLLSSERESESELQGFVDSEMSVSNSDWRKAQSESDIAKKSIPTLWKAVYSDFIKHNYIRCILTNNVLRHLTLILNQTL